MRFVTVMLRYLSPAGLNIFSCQTLLSAAPSSEGADKVMSDMSEDINKAACLNRLPFVISATICFDNAFGNEPLDEVAV